MAVKVYAIRDREAIEHIENGDIRAFEAYLEEDLMLDFEEPECFETEAEALSYCAGLGHGANERGVTEVYPLRSSEDADLEFIAEIERRFMRIRWQPCDLEGSKAIQAKQKEGSTNNRLFCVYGLTNHELGAA